MPSETGDLKCQSEVCVNYPGDSLCNGRFEGVKGLSLKIEIEQSEISTQCCSSPIVKDDSAFYSCGGSAVVLKQKKALEILTRSPVVIFPELIRVKWVVWGCGRSSVFAREDDRVALITSTHDYIPRLEALSNVFDISNNLPEPWSLVCD